MLELCKQREVQQATMGCAMYRPHPKQDKFHRLGRLKFRYLRTGNRFGKSDCGSAEDVAHALGYRPWYSEGDPARYEGIKQKPNKILILCTDWGKAKSVFTNEVEGKNQGKLWKWIPKEALVGRSTNHSGDINQITVKSIWGGESLIIIDTVAAYKQNSLRGESDYFDGIHVDEPIPEEMWTSFARGLIDTKGSAWFTCTPLREPWINRFFIPSSRIVLDGDNANFFPDSKGRVNRVVIVGTSYDNPFVDEESIDEIMDGFSDRERFARLFGKPIDQAGTVHPDFSDDHVYTEIPPSWSEVNKPPLDYTVRVHIDFHRCTPYAVLFSATSPQGQVFFFEEIWEQCSTDEIALKIQEITKDYFVPVVWMDPSGFIKTMQEETTFADDLANYGILCEKASKDLTRGIKLTNNLLKKPGLLWFGAHLTRTLYEFEVYVFQDPEKRPDKPQDKNDHMMEGLHRLCLGGLNHISTEIFDMPSALSTRQHSLLAI